MSEFQITEDNFKEYFFPAKYDYKPKEGQCLASWRATGDFIDGYIKRNIIELLATNKAGAEMAQRMMVNLVSATQKDAVRVLLEMAKDLLAGKSTDEVAEKPYRFVVEQFYWTKPEYIPDDPHWSIISVRDTRIKSKVVEAVE